MATKDDYRDGLQRLVDALNSGAWPGWSGKQEREWVDAVRKATDEAERLLTVRDEVVRARKAAKGSCRNCRNGSCCACGSLSPWRCGCPKSSLCEGAQEAHN